MTTEERLKKEEQCKNEMKALMIGAYEKGMNDAFDGLIESFNKLHELPIKAYPVHVIIKMIVEAKKIAQQCETQFS